ncbi:glycosyltransferase [Rhizobium halophytocola]|uniref:Ceramide glucosyltransferase n=1 Tax=Rhizobium halophytocola TaxID=735519 RepID=A0ABS4DSU2_9HYPH|nr:glycosyltransferase [Rhizobium halophytocola]MBP1848753.1 ceramide glucosyltransferase [Rhizobium halophytocola]
MIGTLTTILLLAGGAQLAGIAIAIRRALRAEKTAEIEPTMPLPPVSILRPLCGLENHLEQTLRSTFLLDWPSGYEILFCVESDMDPAAAVARRLIERYPQQPAQLLVGQDPVSINPKLNNLVKGWHAARHGFVVMADSNVLMPADYLRQLFARWQEDRTGMVCSPPVGSAPDGFAAEIECAWLNSYQARWQLVADEIGLGFAQGKTMMLPRALLDRHGGIARLADEVAEDAAATKIVRGDGLSVRLVTRPFAQPLGAREWLSVWRRQLRWARLRRASFPLFFLPELFVGGALPLIAAFLLAMTGSWPPLSAVGYAGLWYGAELVLIASYGWPLSWRTPAALILRDLALPALWISAWFGNGFEWRGNRMTVREPANAPLSATAAAARQPESLAS